MSIRQPRHASRRRTQRGSLLVASLLFATLVAASPSSHAAERRSHADISIEWDGELNRAHGIVSGNGTPAHPYVISGWSIGNISIRDTTKAISILGNTITGTLRLNWIGHNITVRGNEIADMRVNENIPRWGDPTVASIQRNTFGQVGQLRHFDGVFAWNTVGTRPHHASMTGAGGYPSKRAVNFDGFNGAVFAHNTIYGFVDARIHGHHHGSAFGMPSHMHADGPGSMEMVDHTRRYHEVTIEKNSIYSSGPYALAYLDTNHDGNDRTAPSETNPYLNAPHTHFTRVHIRSNQLTGAGLLVDVFNAQDERHTGRPWGTLNVTGNTISLERDLTRPTEVLNGIEIRNACSVTVTIVGNAVTGAAPLTGLAPLDQSFQRGAGVLLLHLDKARVTIDRMRINNRAVGVQATHMSSSVVWSVTSLTTTNVETPVAYDSSVSNSPTRG